MYPSSINDSGKRKKLLIVGLLVILSIVILAIALTVSNVSKSSNPEPNFAKNGKFTFANSQISISYPRELNQQFVGTKFILRGPGEGIQDSLVIYPYLKKSESTTLESLKAQFTKNGKGVDVGIAESRSINNRNALVIVPADKSLPKTKLSVFVEGNDTIWLIDANFASADSLLAKNITDVINSFIVKSQE